MIYGNYGKAERDFCIGEVQAVAIGDPCRMGRLAAIAAEGR
jgi:hypothetical protein